MAKKIASAVLTVLSYLLLIAAAVCITLFYTQHSGMDVLFEVGMVTAIVGVILGTVAHFLIWLGTDERFRELSAGYKFVYIVSFVPFLPVLIFVVLWGIIKFILIKLGVMAASTPNKPKEITVYTIRDESQNVRKLIIEEKMLTDYKRSGQPNYTRLVDDLGRHWRSYDGCKTFIRDPDVY